MLKGSWIGQGCRRLADTPKLRGDTQAIKLFEAGARESSGDRHETLTTSAAPESGAAPRVAGGPGRAQRAVAVR